MRNIPEDLRWSVLPGLEEIVSVGDICCIRLTVLFMHGVVVGVTFLVLPSKLLGDQVWSNISMAWYHELNIDGVEKSCRNEQTGRPESILGTCSWLLFVAAHPSIW